MKVNTQYNIMKAYDIANAIELDFCLILTSGKSIFWQKKEIKRIMSLYIQKNIIDYYDIPIITTFGISINIYCPRKINITISMP